MVADQVSRKRDLGVVGVAAQVAVPDDEAMPVEVPADPSVLSHADSIPRAGNRGG